MTINSQSDNTITLRLNGEIFTVDALELAGKLNAVIAYWNTVLERNKEADPDRKLRAETGPVCCPAPRAMNKSARSRDKSPDKSPDKSKAK